jgi:hypothetical protein
MLPTDSWLGTGELDQLRRRGFIRMLGGAAAWPLAARAQQAAKLPTIGFLGGSTPSLWSAWVSAFVQRLRELGWVEGRNVAIEYSGLELAQSGGLPRAPIRSLSEAQRT